MTEFDVKLRREVIKYKADNELKLYDIADMIDVPRNEFYQFTSGKRPLNGERVKRLMDALNLKVEVKPKTE